VEADFLNKSIHIHRCSTGEYSAKNSDGVKYHQESLIERILVPSLEPLGLEVKHFLDCIANQCTPSVSAFEGMKALRLAQQIRSLIEQQCLSVTV
jgi:predicted dehydrogenase